MLVREALSLNLDKDVRIHDMLAQKMRHVLSGDIIQPSEEEIQAFYNQNIDTYRTPPTIIAEEIIFETSEELADQIKQLLMNKANSDSLLALEKASINTLPRINASQLGNLFNEEFSDQVFDANQGEWVGPQKSELGQHWLRIIEAEEAKTPSLDEIRNRVRLEWIDQEEESRLQQEVDRLWKKYSLKILGVNIRISRLADSLILTVFILLCDNSSAHDINVTGVGRVFLDETSLGHYSLSIVDQMPPPNSRVVPALQRIGSQILCLFSQPGLNLIDEINLPWQLENCCNCSLARR